ALKTRGVPVHVFVEAVELEPAQMLHRRQCVAPAAISLLERLEDARDAAGAHSGDRRRPHRLDHHLARGHQVHRLVERCPERANCPDFLMSRIRSMVLSISSRVMLPLFSYCRWPLASTAIETSMTPTVG